MRYWLRRLQVTEKVDGGLSGFFVAGEAGAGEASPPAEFIIPVISPPDHAKLTLLF